jgi:MYXO-CTERM domain-containing protein
VIVGGLLGFGMVIGAPPAAAHTVLKASDPADGATVARIPGSVRLEFNEGILPQFATVIVTGPGGRRYEQGKPAIDGARLVQELKEPDQTGKYHVAFRVVSADGHPVTGKISFTLAGAALTESPHASVSPQGAERKSVPGEEPSTQGEPTSSAPSRTPTGLPPERALGAGSGPGSPITAEQSDEAPSGRVSSGETRSLVVPEVAALLLGGVALLVGWRRRTRARARNSQAFDRSGATGSHADRLNADSRTGVRE